MKKYQVIACIFIVLFTVTVSAQDRDPYDLFVEFADLYNSGDFIRAEQCMQLIIESNVQFPSVYYVHAYNNLGLVKKSIGLYNEALGYYLKAEKLSLNEQNETADLATIYSNISRIYTFQKSYQVASDYLDKSIRICQKLNNDNRNILIMLSRAFLNLGIVYYESGDYQKAEVTLKNSLNLKLKHNLPEEELTYLNLAKTYAATGDRINAERYYKKSLEEMVSQFGRDYYRIPEIYFGYADFLSSIGKTEEALQLHLDALRICLKNYGEKHVMVALAYKQIAGFYVSQSRFKEALEQYQNALIAISSGFENSDPFSNPSPGSSLFSVRLLEIIKSKSDALVEYSFQQSDSVGIVRILTTALSTIELAVDLIDRIRNDYLTEENRIYLAENEKETYISAIRTAASLYKLTGDRTLITDMYTVASKAKAAVLQNEIADNDLMWSAGGSDSLFINHKKISNNISAYNNLILSESQKPQPDSLKITIWKDALFDMSRERDMLSTVIRENYPRTGDISVRTGLLKPALIKKSLRRGETIADYVLSNIYRHGKRELYVFIITDREISFHISEIDSLFVRNSDIIRAHCEGRRPGFAEVTDALFYMYETLIRPYESYFSGHNLLVIPDEEIARLPFDTFLTAKPEAGAGSFEGLPWMINRYSVSYGYSSSLLFRRGTPNAKSPIVISFRPGYDTTSGSFPGLLTGADRETKYIHKVFRGVEFSGPAASETNFIRAAGEEAIFHLAMHSVTDTLDSRYSWLAFDNRNDSEGDGRLYNYEISHMRILSPMVVLSACNSGTGTLYHGEGLMSLARSFVLAGASSVVRTSWEVNDETSAAVITGFYRHLSSGMRKDEALRKSKIEFINSSIPELSDPCYWAGYELIGDVSAVRGRRDIVLISVTAAFILVASAVYFLRRRNSRAERSE